MHGVFGDPILVPVGDGVLGVVEIVLGDPRSKGGRKAGERLAGLYVPPHDGLLARNHQDRHELPPVGTKGNSTARLRSSDGQSPAGLARGGLVQDQLISAKDRQKLSSRAQGHIEMRRGVNRLLAANGAHPPQSRDLPQNNLSVAVCG